MATATLLESVDVRRATSAVTRVASCAVIAVALAAGGCDGAGRDLGESCDTTAECGAGLQCLEQVCVPRCHAHVDCGDGAVCDDGECHAVQSAIGDPCYSELACAAGQTCRLAQELHVAPGTCEAEGAGALEGEACTADRDCRQGGCALGRCVSLCDTDDCRRGWTCAEIPLPERSTSVSACLPGNTTIEFELPVPAADPAAPEIFPDLPVPVPSTARSMSLVFEAPTPENTVGASLLKNPRNQVIYREPDLIESYFTNPVRHKPQPGVSVLQVPSSTAAPLLAGIYTVDVHLYRDAPRLPPGERPRVRVVEKLGSAARLDLHFYFLDLAEHPCADRIGTDLSASTAPTLSGFQQLYLAELERIFEAANISLGEVTYDDITALTTANGRPDLDVLDASQAAELFALTTHTSGVSIFFVRSLEPDGPQLLTNDTPGAPIPGTGASGIAIGLDTLCYREWKDLARQTAHGIARHMGLFRNVEPDELPGHVDPIDDSDDSLDNLMNWSEFGGTDLSLGQREILRASPVLR